MTDLDLPDLAPPTPSARLLVRSSGRHGGFFGFGYVPLGQLGETWTADTG